MLCGFPEVSRGLALNGAELIVCPSAFPIQDKDMWDIYFKTRALENACFVAGINQVGHEENDICLAIISFIIRETGIICSNGCGRNTIC